MPAKGLPSGGATKRRLVPPSHRDFEVTLSPPETGNVREAISRRTLDGIAALVRDTEGGDVNFDMAYRCLTILVDVVSPFVLPDVKLTLDKVTGEWRSLARQKEEMLRVQTQEQEKFRERLGNVQQLDEVVF